MPTKVPTRTVSDATRITRFYLLSFLLFWKITLELYGFMFKNFCANAAVVYPTCLWWEGRANFIHVRWYFCTNAISQTWCCARERAHCADACVNNALEAQTCACGRSAQRFSDVISNNVYMYERIYGVTQEKSDNSSPRLREAVSGLETPNAKRDQVVSGVKCGNLLE